MTSRRARAGSFLRDFQEFALKGNVVDIAVAIIISGAFGKIIESFVADVITPALLKPALDAANVQDLARLSLNGILYGKFLAAVLNFIVIAFVIFLMIRAIEAAKRKQVVEEASDPASDLAADAQERLISSLDRVAAALDKQ